MLHEPGSVEQNLRSSLILLGSSTTAAVYVFLRLKAQVLIESPAQSRGVLVMKSDVGLRVGFAPRLGSFRRSFQPPLIGYSNEIRKSAGMSSVTTKPRQSKKKLPGIKLHAKKKKKKQNKKNNGNGRRRIICAKDFTTTLPTRWFPRHESSPFPQKTRDCQHKATSLA